MKLSINVQVIEIEPNPNEGVADEQKEKALQKSRVKST
jgi:hypothetical protein